MQIAEKKRRDADAKARDRAAELQEERKAKAYLQERGADGGRGEGRRRFRAIGNPVAVSPPASPSVSPSTSPPPQPHSHAAHVQHTQRAQHGAAQAHPGAHLAGLPHAGMHPAVLGSPQQLTQHLPHQMATPGVSQAPVGYQHGLVDTSPVHTGAIAAPQGPAMPAQLPHLAHGHARMEQRHAASPGVAAGATAVSHVQQVGAAQPTVYPVQPYVPPAAPMLAAAVDAGPERAVKQGAAGRTGEGARSREGSSQQRQALVDLLREVQGEQQRMREQFEEAARRFDVGALHGRDSPVPGAVERTTVRPCSRPASIPPRPRLPATGSVMLLTAWKLAAKGQ